MYSQYTIFPDSESSKKTVKKRFFPENNGLSDGDRQRIAMELKTRAVIYNASASMADWKKAHSLNLEAERFCQCGSHFKLYECENDGERFRVPLSCHSRICERCGRSYYKRISKSIENSLNEYFSKKVRGYGVHLLTLTVNTSRYGDMPSRKDIKRFYRESSEFLKLFYGKYKCKFNKQGKVIEDQTRIEYVVQADGSKKKVKRSPKYRTNSKGEKVEEWRRYRGAGYISSIELGSNNNLHLHAIVYAPYISQKKLSAAWHKITGDSFVVGIETVRQVKKAAWYVLKYIVKPPTTDSYFDLCDYLEFIKGTRRIRAGGVFYGRIQKEIIDKMKFSCPFCDNRLNNLGVVEGKSDREHPLYKLLQEREKRGSPPPLPTGYGSLSLGNRLWSELKDDFESSFDWIDQSEMWN